MDEFRQRILNFCSRGKHKRRPETSFKLKNENTNIDVRIKRYNPRITYSGILWRLEQIFIQHVQDVNERRKLLQFCQLKISGTFQRLENSKDTFICNVIASLPDDSQFESYKYFNTKIIETLIDDGCDVLKPDSKGDPPLLAAYKLDKLSAVKGFLNKRVDVNVTDKFGSTLLILATKKNDIKTLKLILSFYKLSKHEDQGVDLDMLDLSQNCAISYASLNDNLDICRELLEAGANPNAGFTSPLYQAVKTDSSNDVIALLIQYKASVDVWIDFTGLNTLIAAAHKNRTEVVVMLLEAGAHFPSAWHKNKALMAALKFDNLDIILNFVRRSTDIMSKSSKGAYIIHEAANWGSRRVLEYLINQQDLNLNAKDRYGKTAFFISAENGHYDCLKVLHFASVQCFNTDNRGRNPLDIAIFNNHFGCVDFMLSHLMCPRSHLVNICNVIKAEYDQAQFSHVETVSLLSQFIESCDGDNVGTLLDLSVLTIRKICGPRNEKKISQLPLPTIMKNLILSL